MSSIFTLDGSHEYEDAIAIREPKGTVQNLLFPAIDIGNVVGSQICKVVQLGDGIRRIAFGAFLVADLLGGQLKTGNLWTGQNRQFPGRPRPVSSTSSPRPCASRSA